jgi:ankyrin repeat protein
VQYDLNKMAGKQTMLQFSCRQELVEAVPLLLEAGFNPNLTSSDHPTPPLIIAAQKGNHQILQSLCNHEDIQINAIDNQESRQTALHKIVQQMPMNENCFIQCLEMLLEFRGKNGTIEINAQDASGNTALHYAVHTGNSSSFDVRLHTR